METLVVDDSTAVDAAGTEIVAGWLRTIGRPATLMAALGTSVLGIYAGLARLRQAGALDTRGLTVVQLDEYLGVTVDDRRSLRGWLERDVVKPLGVERVIGLPSDAADPAAACHAYDDLVAAAGGIDVAVLGLGPNGHLGFNEPPSPADAPTRVVDLTAASIKSNARYWGDPADVPRRALTCGMSTILSARHILLVVTGESKRDILRRMLAGAPTADLPGSLLRPLPQAALLADRAALPDG